MQFHRCDDVTTNGSKKYNLILFPLLLVHPSCAHQLITVLGTCALNTIRYDTIGEFNVDWKAEYSALSSTRSQKKKLKQPTPVDPPAEFFYYIRPADRLFRRIFG